jgi:hypothetical protein
MKIKQQIPPHAYGITTHDLARLDHGKYHHFKTKLLEKQQLSFSTRSMTFSIQSQ